MEEPVGNYIMKTLKMLLPAFCLFLFPDIAFCFSLVSFFTSSHVNWGEIQKVGGLEVSEPRRTDKGWFLPVRCNLAGTEFIIIQPQTINSAIAAKEVRARIIKGKIQIWVVSCVASSDYPDARTNGVELKKIMGGKYLVEYLNRDGTTVPITTVTLQKHQIQTSTIP